MKIARFDVNIIGNLAFAVAVFGGMIVTLSVIIGFLISVGRLAADQEFPAQQRPENLADFPLVTIVVPARNEERNIAFCLESLLALDYPRFNILVVDDNSSDRTAEIVRNIIERAANLPDMQFFQIGDDPDERGVEWDYGKSRALWYGAQKAQGEWILFVDADTRQKSDTLWRAMSFAQHKNLQALSLSGVIVNTGFWGRILEAVVIPAVFLAIPWHRVNKPDDPTAWMNGNFILYKRATYFTIDGHRAIAKFPQEDLALAYHSKAKKVRFLFLPVSSAYKCYDYVGLKEAFRGWTRRLVLSGARLNLDRRFYVLEACALFVIAVWPILAVVAGLFESFARYRIFGMGFSSWALIHLGLVILFQGGVRIVMKMPVWPAVFAPLGAAMGIGVVFEGYRVRYLKKIVEQRGRVMTINDDAG